MINFKQLEYNMAWGTYNGHLFLPILTSLNGIYLLFFFSRGLSKILPQKDILMYVGKHSFHILANHLFVFFLLNLFYVHRHHLNVAELNNIWYKFFVDKNWIIYVVLAITVPVLLAFILDKFQQTIKMILGTRLKEYIARRA
jgi:fucose 4-O-acetylase-like acetyltransferase